MTDGNPFTLLFDDVVAEVGLLPAAVYGVVWRYCQRRHQECYAAQQTLADHLGITRQTLNKHLSDLVEAGYIEDVTPERGGQAHTYRLTDKRTPGSVTIGADMLAGFQSPDMIDERDGALYGRNHAHHLPYAARPEAEVAPWRMAVLERDNYTCQRCGNRGVKLHAHHVEPWFSAPELRYDIDNGVTLCRDCHHKMHGKGWKRRAGRVSA